MVKMNKLVTESYNMNTKLNITYAIICAIILQNWRYSRFIYNSVTTNTYV